MALIIVGTGIVFNVIFHVGIKEPPSDALKGWLDELKNGKQRRNKSNRIGKEREGENMSKAIAVPETASPLRRNEEVVGTDRV